MHTRENTTVLWITMDELHRDALSCYGATSHQTPNLDKLSSDSLWFQNAYTASPICLPSRVSMATGLLPHNSKSVSNIFGASLNRSLPNVFNLYKQAGYHTSMIGKCHFVPVPYREVTPENIKEYEHFKLYYQSLGMDYLQLQDGNAVSAWFYDDYSKYLESCGLMQEYKKQVHDKSNQSVFPFPGPTEMHPDSWVGQNAVDYINSVQDENPNFMWVSFSGPHYPINTPEEFYDFVDMDNARKRVSREGEWEDESKVHSLSYNGPGMTEGSSYVSDGAQKNYKEEYWEKWRKGYFANVVQIDQWIGKILDAANKRWGDNILVVFTTDHGDMMGNHGIWAKNKAVYEDIIKVPLFVKLPNQTEGKILNERVSTIDILPTCLAVTGLPSIECDGKDLRDVVKNGGRDIILSEMANVVAIINGNTKMVLSNLVGKNFKELYDIEKDPYEFENEYNNPQYSEKIEKLHKTLAQLNMDEKLLDVLFYEGKGKPYWIV